jgi:uncharacterized membrane protein HdeD (DUF308 family)
MIVTSPVTEVRKWTRAQMEVVSKGWWVLLLTGLVSLVAGAIIFFIDWNVDDLAVFVGTLLVVRGAFTTISIPIDGSMRTWSVVLGVVEMFVGFGVFLWPGPALLVVAFSIGWMLAFRGTMAIVGSISSREYLPYWGVVLTAGILELLVALYLLTRPDITLIAAVLAIGFASMLYGALEVVIAFEVKHLPDTFDNLIEQTGRDAAAGQLNPIGR